MDLVTGERYEVGERSETNETIQSTEPNEPGINSEPCEMVDRL